MLLDDSHDLTLVWLSILGAKLTLVISLGHDVEWVAHRLQSELVVTQAEEMADLVRSSCFVCAQRKSRLALVGSGRDPEFRDFPTVRAAAVLDSRYGVDDRNVVQTLRVLFAVLDRSLAECSRRLCNEPRHSAERLCSPGLRPRDH